MSRDVPTTHDPASALMLEPEYNRAEVSFSFSAEMVVLADGSQAAGSALHATAAQIMAQQLHQGRRGIAICGPSPGAGVTFIASNIAVALAQAGVSTLLVDANLRDSGVDRIIIPSRPLAGLAQMLRAEDGRRDDVEHHDVIPNLSIVYSGGPAPDASELLGGGAFRAFVQDCMRNFEFTIIDTPPANGSADCRAISAMVGYTLIVARRDQSFIDDVATLTAQLKEDGVIVVGALLNGA